MAHPESARYLPIREALVSVLAAAPELAEVKAIVRDREALARLPVTRHPALGVVFSDAVGDHSYRVEVIVAVRSLESAQACEDLLFAYVEAVEDTLRAAPTLAGVVRSMAVSLVRRSRAKVESYWHSEAVLLVTCEQRTP